MKHYLQRFLALSMSTNIGGLKSIVVVLCFGITICIAGIAGAETVTYSWNGTIVSVEADDGTGIYAGTQVGDTFSGTFTYDPDEANIAGLSTSDGDSVIEPEDLWVEYHFAPTSSAVLTDGMTDLYWPGVTLSITTDYPLDDQGELDWIYDLFGIEIALGTLADGWGLDFGDGIFEFALSYTSAINMQDDLSFRPNPPWSPPESPDDPDKQIATFEILEYSDYDQEELIYAAFGVVTGMRLEVIVDIKPGSDPNCFNVNGHGVIPVAILGSDTFYVTDIDQGSLSFGGLSVRIRGNKGPLCRVDYSNGDEYLDLVCQFEDNSDFWNPGEDDATVTGTLMDGTEFEGTDSICVVPH
jgi:hypothetical protein